MATITINLPADAGGFLRSLSKRIQELSFDIPDQTPTGAANVLTIDNNPGAGTLSVQVTSGAYPTGKHKQ
jgi:hypothetical protein